MRKYLIHSYDKSICELIYMQSTHIKCQLNGHINGEIYKKDIIMNKMFHKKKKAVAVSQKFKKGTFFDTHGVVVFNLFSPAN